VLSPIASTVSAFHEKYGFKRSEEVVAALSAQAQNFTTRPSSSRIAFPLREDSYVGDTGGSSPASSFSVWGDGSLAGVLAAAENLASGGVLVPIPASPRTAWTSWLREQPGKLTVAHVPLPRGLHSSARDTAIPRW
jgi:hypothetical protein